MPAGVAVIDFEFVKIPDLFMPIAIRSGAVGVAQPDFEHPVEDSDFSRYSKTHFRFPFSLENFSKRGREYRTNSRPIPAAL
jgi:hypothetical protein